VRSRSGRESVSPGGVPERMGNRMAATILPFAVVRESPDDPVAATVRHLDPDAIEALVERYGHRLLRYLVHLAGDRAMAEDLFQETWVRVLERGRQYDRSRPFVGWLLGIARHLAQDALRRDGRVRDGGRREGSGDAEALRDAGASPLESVVAREVRERVASAVAGLPAAYREVLYLRFEEEMALAEIARVVGAPVPTVKTRLYRGLRNLAQRLGEPA
jgi:RNA polymerase sigma-70 factor (ECF subfamily)